MRRPVLAVVANLLIVIAGLAAFRGVEIRELPDVDRPVITVRANYEGATPETIDRQVTDILEGAASRVPGVKSISSTSRSGTSRVVVEFGESAVDTSMMTGESVPADAAAGARVAAGTVVVSGRLVVVAGRTGDDTQLAHLIALV